MVITMIMINDALDYSPNLMSDIIETSCLTQTQDAQIIIQNTNYNTNYKTNYIICDIFR